MLVTICQHFCKLQVIHSWSPKIKRMSSYKCSAPTLTLRGNDLTQGKGHPSIKEKSATSPLPKSTCSWRQTEGTPRLESEKCRDSHGPKAHLIPNRPLPTYCWWSAERSGVTSLRRRPKGEKGHVSRVTLTTSERHAQPPVRKLLVPKLQVPRDAHPHLTFTSAIPKLHPATLLHFPIRLQKEATSRRCYSLERCKKPSEMWFPTKRVRIWALPHVMQWILPIWTFRILERRRSKVPSAKQAKPGPHAGCQPRLWAHRQRSTTQTSGRHRAAFPNSIQQEES